MPTTDRRTFIKGTAGAAFALAAASTLPSGCRGYDQAPGGLVFFNNREYQIFKAIADTIIPAGGANAKSASALGVADNLDKYMLTEPSRVQQDFKSAINLFEYGPLLFDLKLTRFSRLTPDEQYRHMESWAYSSLNLRRTIFQAFKKSVMFAYYADPSTWPAIGYGGTLL